MTKSETKETVLGSISGKKEAIQCIPVCSFYENFLIFFVFQQSEWTSPTTSLPASSYYSPVNVSIVAGRRLVFDMRSVDGNLTGLLFGSAIDIFVGHGLTPSLITQHPGNRLGQGSLSVIDVTDGSNVHMWLGTIIFGGKPTSRRQSQQHRTIVGGAGAALHERSSRGGCQSRQHGSDEQRKKLGRKYCMDG
jgi:hypothetical protein